MGGGGSKSLVNLVFKHFPSKAKLQERAGKRGAASETVQVYTGCSASGSLVACW